MQHSIEVDKLGKYFKRYHTQKPVTLMEAALTGFQNIRSAERFWALRNVSFSVSPGEMLGIIGHNGAGKSTLLQILGGVTQSTEGTIQMHGRVGALLDLGAGFHADLTGRENALTSSIVAGLSRRRASRQLDQIIAFAELEEFIDNPVRTYSSGMLMRLAFSVAVHTDPQILLVDEFLSVGDLAFQTKCLNRITDLKDNGCAIVLVSHDVTKVELLCDKALWLSKGQVQSYGEPKVVAGQYAVNMRSKTSQCTPQHPPIHTKTGIELRTNHNRFGSLEAEIIDVHLLHQGPIRSGNGICVEIQYVAHQLINSPIFGVTLTKEDGTVCLDSSTENSGLRIRNIQGAGKVELDIHRLELVGGKYFMNVNGITLMIIIGTFIHSRWNRQPIQKDCLILQ
jgi:lipopolysaccharide transport system ATP-binding protein